MTDFSIGDAAFTGFRLIRAKPKVFALWIAIQLVLGLGGAVLLISSFGPTLAQLTSGDIDRADPAQSIALIQKVAPLYAFVILAALILYPIIYAAMNRAILHPNDDRFGYLRIGPDEFRQLGLMLLYGLTMIGFEIGLVIAVFIMGMIGAAIGTAAKVAMLAPLVGILAAFAVMAGLLFVAVRLSLASPLTFATGRINLFGSWKLTKGRFWPLLGTALVVFFITAGLYILTFIVTLLFAIIPGTGVTLSSLLHPDWSSAAVYLTPGRIVLQILSTTLGTIMLPLWLTPPAAIYRILTSASSDGAGQASVPGLLV